MAKTYASSEQSERRNILTNDIQPEIAYRLTPKMSVSAVYRNYLFGYRDSILDDNSYVQNDVGGRIYYHATPKLDLYVHGSGILTEYYQSGIYDSTGFKVLAGSAGRVTEKITVNLETGFKKHNYEDSTINSFNDWVLLSIIEYQITAKSRVSLLLKRDKEESVYRNVGWFQADTVGVVLKQRVTNRITAHVGTTVQWNRYPRETTESQNITDKRRDFIMESHANFKWRLHRYLTLGLGYRFLQRQSNFDNNFEYLDHIVDASVSLGAA